MNDIYLDFQATTPTDARVAESMRPWWETPANPHAAGHAMGRRAAAAVEEARSEVAALIGADPAEITFTSGATEAANLALRSVVARARLAASEIEHACVLETLSDLENSGAKVSRIPVTSGGIIDLDALGDLLDAGIDLVCIMAVNNEVGTVQPVADAASMSRSSGATLFSDLSQAVGRIEVDVGAWGIDMACVSSHKVYGPQGIGALFVRDGLRVRPLATGGGQEKGLRPGTVPTALAVGFGHACRIAAREIEADARHARSMNDRFMAQLRERLPGVRINGDATSRVPHNLSLRIPGIDADTLMAAVPEVCISSGSACSSGALGYSHVLRAMGLTHDEMERTIRIGFGRTTTGTEVDAAARLIATAVIAGVQPPKLLQAGTRP